jgi:hypothetical protein
MYEFKLWLAYADVIYNKIEKIQQGLVELQNKLYGTGNAIQGISKTLDKLFQRQDNIIKLLEVVYNNLPEVLIPDWRTLEEVYNGDDMGLDNPHSANSIGLLVDFYYLQDEPGFEHEEVVASRFDLGRNWINK